MSLENGTPGVVYDTLGLPGAYAAVFLRTHRPYFRAQLRQRKPSLVVLMFGGNEAFRLSRDWTKPEEIQQEAEALVKLVRESSPESACLVCQPHRRGGAHHGRRAGAAPGLAQGGGHLPRGGPGGRLRLLGRAQRPWATRAPPSGGSSAGMLNEDLIHPRSRGSDLLGHLFDLALQRAYAAEPPPHAGHRRAPGLRDADKALGATFASLRALEKGEGARVDLSADGRLAHGLALLHGRGAPRAGRPLRGRGPGLHRRGQTLGPAQARGRVARADGRVDGGGRAGRGHPGRQPGA